MPVCAIHLQLHHFTHLASCIPAALSVQSGGYATPPLQHSLQHCQYSLRALPCMPLACTDFSDLPGACPLKPNNYSPQSTGRPRQPYLHHSASLLGLMECKFALVANLQVPCSASPACPLSAFEHACCRLSYTASPPSAGCMVLASCSAPSPPWFSGASPLLSCMRCSEQTSPLCTLSVCRSPFLASPSHTCWPFMHLPSSFLHRPPCQ